MCTVPMLSCCNLLQLQQSLLDFAVAYSTLAHPLKSHKFYFDNATCCKCFQSCYVSYHVISAWATHVGWLLQLLVATGQGNVAYLEVEAGKLKQVGHHKLDAEVACLNITPVGQALIITPAPLLHVCTTCGLQHNQEAFLPWPAPDW